MSFDERMDRLVERQQALAESLELLTKDVHDMQATMKDMQVTMAAADKRERTLRIALLKGVTEFLSGLNGDGEAD
jgi:hypothetical protein